MEGKIKIVKNGPYLVQGGLPLDEQIILRDKLGFSTKWKEGKKYKVGSNYTLCRCGLSKNKPFCDGTHIQSKFNGKETARRSKYLSQAQKIDGPKITLTDNQSLCFGAGFCHNKNGDVWDLVKETNLQKVKLAIAEACNCPSGRLVVWDNKTGKAIEPKFTPSISLLQEPDKEVSGPIWVKGNVEIISADGKAYEIRNRVTLCRCGRSRNKPYCDGTHVEVGFTDRNNEVK